MSLIEKHMAGFKPSQLKNNSFAENSELFLLKAMTGVTCCCMDTELVKESSKKAEAKMAQECRSIRKGVKHDAIPLATKPPSIVDYKIIKEGKISIYQIIRADGSSKRYSTIIHMLRSFDREDLETLWKIVKARHGYTTLEEGYDELLDAVWKLLLLVEVKTAQLVLLVQSYNCLFRVNAAGTKLQLLKDYNCSRRKQRKDTEIPQSNGPTKPIVDEAANEENVPTQSNDLPLSRVNTIRSGEDKLTLKELMDLYTKLSDRVLDLETIKTAQAKEIASLKKRVKKLERKRKSKNPEIKRLFKISRSAQVVSSEDEGLGDQEDASKQGRKIDDIDKYAEVTLVNETQGKYNDSQMFDTDVFDGEEVFVAEQSEKVVKEVVSTAEVSAASTTTTTPSIIPKAKSITFRDLDESTLTPIPSNIKDKGKAKMIEPEKMKEQIRLDEELAFKLQAEEEELARLAREKAEKVKEANISWDNV
ncbi:hypothetical protein Tco_1077995 [Tanacetum coccineum]